MPNPYNDPRLQDSEYPEQLQFTRPGDSFAGEVISVDVIDTKFGPTLKYMLLSDKTDQQVSLLAGSVNLKGQMMSLQPQPGDHLTLELVELRPSSMGNPTKIYRIDLRPGDVAGRDDTQSAPESPREAGSGTARGAPPPDRRQSPKQDGDEGDIFS